MPKKKKIVHKKQLPGPFSSLKGFAVSETLASSPTSATAVGSQKSMSDDIDFDSHMASLGVRSLDRDEPVAENAAATEDVAPGQSAEEDTFLAAMRQLEVQFNDSVIENDHRATPVKHPPRRMKQLSKGTLVPQATLDLHGVKRQEVAAKLSAFITNARYHGWYVLLVITGKGLHSTEGKGVLRHCVEDFLQGQGRGQVAEWGVAPRQYGGDGAVVLFLRRRT